MQITGWSRGLEVPGGGAGVVSHAGVALLRPLADNTGLTAGLSTALASSRMLVHDRGRVVADLACAIADGAVVISDFRVMTDQDELFGPVASVPTAWRTLAEIAGGGHRRGPPSHRRGERRPAARLGAGSRPGMARCPGSARGQDDGRRDLHPARRHRLPSPLGQGTRGAELQGVRSVN